MRHHERRGLHIGIRESQRKLYALVLPEGPSKNYALFSVTAGAIEEPARVANALRGNQDALSVQPVQKIAEATALFPDQISRRDFHVIKEDFSGGVVHHGAYSADRQPVSHSLAQVHQQHGKSFTSLL